MCFFTKNLSIDFFNSNASIRFAHKKTAIQPQEFSLHLNDCVEFYIYISGDADYIVGDDRMHLTPGDVLAISPYEIHTPVFTKPCSYERFYMLFPLSAFLNYGFDPLLPFLHKSLHPKVPLAANEKEQVLKLLYELSTLSEQEKNEASTLRSAGLILEFIGILSNAILKETRPGPENSSGVPPLVRDILTYISLNVETVDTVRELAKQFYISPPYLSSIFKKYVGINVNTYIRIKKIATAKKLLDQGFSVTDTCYRCGFSDCSYFIKTFKSYVGSTPFQYKNKGLSD